MPQRYVVGGFDGWSRELWAVGATFVLGDRLLTLDHARGASEIRAETLRHGDTRWTIAIPNFAALSLRATEKGLWRAVGRRGKRLTRIEGTVGSSDTVRTDWRIDEGDQEYAVDDRVDDGDVGIALAVRWSKPPLPLATWNWRAETSILRVAADGTTRVATTRLTLNCLEPTVGVTGFVCIAFDGRWSRLWRFDARANRLIPIGQTRAFVWGKQSGQDRVIGILHGRQMQLRLDSATIDLLPSDDDECVVSDHALAGDLVATACTFDGETIVKLYRLGEPTATSAP
jgi:hypothetical protein